MRSWVYASEFQQQITKGVIDVATKAQINSFVEQIAPLIQIEAKRRGYSICSTVIAQAGIESAWNTSVLGYKYNNFFGMKCGSSWKGGSVNLKTKEEYTVGVLTSIKDNFRTYPSMAAGVAGYYDFISTKRYANLKTAKTYKEYAQMLKADGYATSSTYVNTLCTTVEKYGLVKYDIEQAVSAPAVPTLSIGSRHPEVVNVQKYLALKGYQVGAIDGIYGQQTSSCVRQYQVDWNLTHDSKISVDGIWGKQCWATVGIV